MSARALCRRVAALRLLASTPGREVWRSRCQRWDGGHGEEEEEGRVPAPRPGEYLVQYNPAAYETVPRAAAAAASCGAEDEEPAPPPLAPPFRQQGNPYSVRSSRSLSSSQNTLLDLALSRGEGGKKPASAAAATPPREDPPGGFEPRAFQKCRPEYAAVSHDPAHRPTPISADEAFLLLNKVSVLRGSLGPQDVVGFLGELARLPPEQLPLVRGHSCFSMLLRYAVESLRLLSDAQLLEALRALASLGLHPAHGVLGLLEAEFGRRATEGMEPRRLLLAADLWRCLGRPVPQFLEQLYGSAAGWRWSDMGPAELVQLVYVMGEGRRSPADLLPTLELQLLRHLDRLTAEELGAVCLGLFKSQSSLSPGAVVRLANRACALLPEMSDYGLVNALKLLRFSYLDHRGLLRALATEMPRRAPRMGVPGLMHVALACSALHHRDDGVLQAVADRLPALVPPCRSKDAAKLLWAFGTVGFPPSRAPRLYPGLAEALRQREAEFRRFPEHLLTGLLGLAFAGIFPTDLLAQALSPDFAALAAASRHLELKKDLFTVDASVGLEVPGWAGPRVDRALAEEVTAQLWSFALQDVCVKPEVLEAERLLGELLGGAAYVRKHMILPHTRSIDLEVRLDPAGGPVPLCSEGDLHGPGPESVSPAARAWERGLVGVTITEDLLAQLTNIKGPVVSHPTEKPDSRPAHSPAPTASRDRAFPSGAELTEGLLEALRRPGAPSPCPTRGVQRLAVQVSNRNHFCYRSRQLLGLHAMKRRQLALLGYSVVELHYWEWFPLLKRSRAERLAYLRSKILGHLD
ncbi:LOW QUALITY PROTEIN: FAST kinase domain-containing protein 5, mitochondrial [Anguilla anguilla]|uniref:LOW QUALITY PROTEIN: FAST kinase domain-containing protein 5, mitochondrial n=1 Tax=Anguilla anguilla TaxID=7936 RepID=UPI0015AC8B19|nr:LOW QUALITY PROTEIN: FAST kinase domain-containing protein 5, mitochondrial [Anguilla anguilla]